MNPTTDKTLEAFQHLDHKARLLGDLKHQLAGARFSDAPAKDRLDFATKAIMQAEEIIKTMYDDIAEALYHLSNRGDL